MSDPLTPDFDRMSAEGLASWKDGPGADPGIYNQHRTAYLSACRAAGMPIGDALRVSVKDLSIDSYKAVREDLLHPYAAPDDGKLAAYKRDRSKITGIKDRGK